MNWFHALILGFIQGLTEFLPISSSGHLAVVPVLLGWEQQPLAFDVVLHLGTATALIIYFKNDIRNIFSSINSELKKKKHNPKKYSYETKLGLFIILGSIPAGIIGFFFEDIFENYFRETLTVALFLTLGSLLMFYAEKKASKRALFSELTGPKAIIIGLFQSLALFPGVSRSGATISGGMIMGLHREYAARFSFLLSIPIVLGAGLFKVFSTLDYELAEIGLRALLVGYLASFISGYLAIDLLLRFLRNRGLNFFIVYRLALAGLIIFTLMR